MAFPHAALVAPGARCKPNIIFVLTDDLGYGDLGCCGQTEIRTPRLDRMAAEGTRFTSFCALSALCAFSRCALMTGLPTRTGSPLSTAACTLRMRSASAGTGTSWSRRRGRLS